MMSKFILRSLVSALAVTALSAFGQAAKSAFSVQGMYFEGCSCSGPCPCELTGPNMSCEGVGLYSFTNASYGGKSLSGVKAAYAVGVGKWVKIYVDAPASKRASAIKFMKAMLADFGKVESARAAKISITGSKGKYVGMVDGGKVMKIKTAAMMGGDHKTPMTYTNIQDPVVHDVMQGKTVAATYMDGGHTFNLSGTNAYFNPHIHTAGKL